MFDVVVRLLAQTFQAQGSDPTSEIQESYQILVNLSQQADFFPTIYQIILSEETNSIKHAALIFLDKYCFCQWFQIPQETKSFILENFAKIVQYSCNEFLSTMKHISFKLIGCTYFQGEWPELNNLILRGLNEESSFSFIVSYAICLYLNQKTDSEEREEFAEQIIPIFTQYIINSSNLIFMGICFDCARFITVNPNICQFLSQNIDIWIKKASQLLEYRDFPEFIAYSRSAIKFASSIIHDFPGIISDDVVFELYNTLMELFHMAIPQRLMRRCIDLLKCFMDYEPTWVIICNNIEYVVSSLIFPFFILPDEKVFDAVNNPKEFIEDYETDVISLSDIHAYLLAAVKQKAISSPELAEAVYSNLLENINKTPQLAFAALNLFSAVAQVYQVEFFERSQNFFYANIEDESLFIRAGIISCIKSFKNIELPPELIDKLIQRIGDNSVLVQYYSLTTISAIIENRANRKSHCLFEKNISHILNFSYLLMVTFNSFDTYLVMTSIIDNFPKKLLENASSILGQLFDYYMQIVLTEPQNHVGVLISSFFKLIKLVSKQAETAQVTFTQLIEKIYGMIKELIVYRCDSVDNIRSLMELLAAIINNSPVISEIHWQFIHLIPIEVNQNIDDTFMVLRNLITQDVETANSNIAELVNLGINYINKYLNYPYDRETLSVIFFYFATLFHVIIPNQESLEPIIKQLLNISISYIDNTVTRMNATHLITEMLINSPEFVFSILGGSREQFLADINDSMEVDEHIALILNCNKYFSSEEVFYLIESVLKKMKDMDFDDEEDFLDINESFIYFGSNQLYNYVEVLTSFECFLIQFGKNYPNDKILLDQKLDQDIYSLISDELLPQT